MEKIIKFVKNNGTFTMVEANECEVSFDYNMEGGKKILYYVSKEKNGEYFLQIALKEKVSLNNMREIEAVTDIREKNIMLVETVQIAIMRSTIDFQ